MAGTDLLPCPWCGELPDIHKHNQFYVCDHWDCDHYGGGSYFESEAVAIEWWNTRAERTCCIIGFDDGVDEGIDGEWHKYSEPQYDLSCGHASQGTEPPNYCSICGAKVIGGKDGVD